MRRVDTLMLGGLGARGEGDDRRWDGWIASPTQWTWVWVNSGSWWWTGRPGVLWFMGLQRVRHDWATELNWTEYFSEWGNKWLYLYPMWMFTKDWPQQRRILIIKWTEWPISWIPLSLFARSPHHPKMDSWISQPWWHQWLLGFICHWVPNLSASENNTEFLKLHILQGGPLATGLMTLNCLHRGRNSVLFLETELTLYIDLPSLPAINLCHSTVGGLTECLIYCVIFWLGN